ncbi:MAG: carbonic anhydrase, partial [Allosphingosinicella sp.]
MADFAGLIEGYRRFRRSGWSEQRQRWAELAEGQSPKVMVIACSDSRVDPAQIFDARPGEIFVVRNVGNLVPPFEPDSRYHGVSAALEFAVTQLEVDDLVVMGHGFCGGCAAALTGQFDEA